MSALFIPSLVPIVLLSSALGLAALRGAVRRPGLAAWCFATALWALSLLLVVDSRTRPAGDRMLMVGFFVPAAFLHAVAEDLGGRAPVRLAYGLAGGMTAVGAVWPHLFLREGGTEPGPAFPLMFGLAFLMSVLPLVKLAAALRQAPEGATERLRYMALAGFLGVFGGGLNVLWMLRAQPYPAGLYMALGSQVLLAMVVQGARLPAFGRFVERSLRYSLLAALLSALWVGLALAVLRLGGAGLSYSWGAGFLLLLLVLAGQPVLAWARGWLAGTLFPGQGDLSGMAQALARSEARAEQASRLAEIGVLASAVAHEVRNPLGVIAACTSVLARQGADPGAVDEIRAQVERAARFAEELLEYGRPAPLTLRPVDLAAAASLAGDEVRRALPLANPPQLEVRGEAPAVSADLGQIVRLFGILLENAALAVDGGRIRVTLSAQGEEVLAVVEDSGPGVPEAVLPRLFQPFASGRGREGPRPGTGLGLAIARGIAERHHGTLACAGRSAELGGARFELTLPVEPPVPAGG